MKHNVKEEITSIELNNKPMSSDVVNFGNNWA